MENKKSFEEMEKALLEACENGFESIPFEERQKQLEEQRKSKGWKFGLSARQRLEYFKI